MTTIRPAAALAAALVAYALPAPAADVGVSIAISQPGVYGRVDIGRFPAPAVIVQQPVWAMPPPVVVQRPEPVYLWVPPGHRRHWRRHCAQYHACDTPVYFVQEGWYRRHVMPAAEGPGRGHGRGHGRGYER
ncbi:MAG: hypothetical protein U1F56_01715 [Rubrivivax sp.]